MNNATIFNAPLVRQFSFTANLDIAKLTKDALGYTRLIFTGDNNSKDLCIKMNPGYNDLHDTLMDSIARGKLDANSQVSVTVKQSETKSAIYLRIINNTENGGNIEHPISGFASVMLLFQPVKRAA